MNGNLRIPATVGIGETKKNDIIERWSTIEEVESQLAAKGLKEGPKPSFECPEVTEESLTTTDHSAYTRMYAQMLAWFNYVSPMAARVKCRVLEYTNMIKRIEAASRKELVSKNKHLEKNEKLSATEIENAILLDPNYETVAIELQKYTQYKIQLEAFLETLENSMKVISRQVEIKKLEFGGVNREGNIPTRHPVPSSPFGGSFHSRTG